MYDIFVLVLSVLSLVMVWGAPLDSASQLLVTVMILVGAGGAILSWRILSNQSDAKVLVGMINGYYFVGALFKIPVLLFYPEEIDVPGDVPISSFSDEFASGFFLFLLGYLGFLVGVCLFFLGQKSRVPGVKYISYSSRGLWSLVGVSLVLITLKLFAQLALGIATPGVTPVSLPIPFLTGIIWLLALVSTFLAVNCTLFFCMVSGRKALILLSFSFVVVNVASDLAVGTKSSLMYEFFVLTWFYFALRRSGPLRSKELFYLMGLIGLGAGVVVLYKYINFYRYALLAGLSLEDAISSAVRFQESHGGGSVVAILNRINGLDTIIISNHLIGDYEIGFLEYLTDGAVNAVRYAVYGVGFDEILGAFGTTQFVPAFMLWGFAGVFFVFTVLGLLQSLVVRFLAIRAELVGGVFVAATPVVVTECIKVIFSSGGFDLILKTFFVLCITAVLLGKISCWGGSGRKIVRAVG